MRIALLSIFGFILLCGACFAETYVVLNADNSIHTISKKNDTVVKEGQRIVMVNKGMEEFALSLPDHPAYCRLVGDEYIADETLKPEPKFDKQAFEHQMFNEFLPAHPELESKYLIISRCIDYNNVQGWNSLKQYIKGMLQAGVITKEVYDEFKTILKAHNGKLKDE